MKINELELNKSYLLLDLDGSKKEIKILSKNWVIGRHRKYDMLFVADDEQIKVFDIEGEYMEFEDMKEETNICGKE